MTRLVTRLVPRAVRRTPTRAATRRRLLVPVAALLVVAGGTVATTTAMSGGDDADPAPESGTVEGSTAPKATATVTRGDLKDTETVDGTLGHGEVTELIGGASGTLTWIRAVGGTVGRGARLYELNSAPVILMYGSEPMYRTLSSGSAGDDVRQLERNLHALGYGDDMTVDGEFTSATAQAVQDWQDDRGLPETGIIDPSQIVFAPHAVRVSDHKVALGARVQGGAPVLSVTGTRHQVRVDLKTSDQHLADKGAKVTIELPGNAGTVDGRISRIGTVATPQTTGTTSTGQQSSAGSSAGSSAASTSAEPTIEVAITLDDPKKAGGLDEAPVSVRMQGELHRNVLSVPIEALLALRGGGYGVQLVQGGTAPAAVRVVPVRIGLFAEGRAEVAGAGLSEGARVGVPAK